MDWGTVVARRGQKASPNKGGWHIYHTGIVAADTVDPTQKWIRAAGDQALNGWAKNPGLEAEIANWFDASESGQQHAIVGRINRAATEEGVYAPLGAYLSKYAFRSNLTGISSAPVPLFWGVTINS